MIKNFKKKKNNKGFTLVELLVVIAIIGVLAVVAVPSLFSNINKSKAAQVESDYATIKTAVMAEYADNTALTTIISSGVAGLKVEGIKSPVNYTLRAGTSSVVMELKVLTENETVANKVVTDLGANLASIDTDANNADKAKTVIIKLIKS